MSPTTATALQDMMVNVVQNGTGKNAQIPGATVGGKTGTAQQSDSQNPLAWFISYASVNGKSVAVAVLVQDDNAAHRQDISGGGFAAPVAQAVMKAVLGL
jgi:penicillin-binding protein A